MSTNILTMGIKMYSANSIDKYVIFHISLEHASYYTGIGDDYVDIDTNNDSDLDLSGWSVDNIYSKLEESLAIDQNIVNELLAV